MARRKEKGGSRPTLGQLDHRAETRDEGGKGNFFVSISFSSFLNTFPNQI
jgi:hypothetical protein